MIRHRVGVAALVLVALLGPLAMPASAAVTVPNFPRPKGSTSVPKSRVMEVSMWVGWHTFRKTMSDALRAGGWKFLDEEFTRPAAPLPKGTCTAVPGFGLGPATPYWEAIVQRGNQRARFHGSSIVMVGRSPAECAARMRERPYSYVQVAPTTDVTLVPRVIDVPGRGPTPLAPALPARIASVAATARPDGRQQFMLWSDGSVTSPNGPTYGGVAKPASPPVAMAATAKGYWIALKDGTVHAVGDAPRLPAPAKRPAVALAATSTGEGYWLVAADGGVSAVGDARAFAATGPAPVAPITAIAVSPAGDGYWLLAKDGRVYPRGAARFHGGANGRLGTAAAVGLVPTTSGDGYWIASSTGGVLPFGAARAPVYGWSPASNPVVAAVRGAVNGGYILGATGSYAEF